MDEFQEHFSNDRHPDIEVFTYTAQGFFINIPEITTEIKWTDIQTIFGYKIDLLTFDEICIEVFYDYNHSFKLSEYSISWDSFLKKIKEQFPEIDENWHFDIIPPAFKSNLTLIYERGKSNF